MIVLIHKNHAAIQKLVAKCLFAVDKDEIEHVILQIREDVWAKKAGRWI